MRPRDDPSRKLSEPGEVSRSFRAANAIHVAPRNAMGMLTKRGNAHQETTKHARAISDANWGEIVRQLEYKAEWYGRKLVKIDRYFPSSRALL